MIKAFLFTFMMTQVTWALAPGDQVFNFAAKNQNGKIIHLNDFRGKFVVLYFYPKDETPGCSTEASGLRDKYVEIQSLNGVILGVSTQDEKSHKAFIDKYHLPFDLLVDSDSTMAKQMGVGSVPVLGFAKRQSLLIGRDGKLIKFYDDVDPEKHAQEIVEDLRKANK